MRHVATGTNHLYPLLQSQAKVYVQRKLILVESRRSWALVREESKFIDWQKVKVQEKSDEVCSMIIDVVKLQCVPAVAYHLYLMLDLYQNLNEQVPAGSLPRTMEVILRNNVVESARAGDEMTFVGTLLVVPDVAAITAPGEKVQTKPGLHVGEVGSICLLSVAGSCSYTIVT